MTPHPSSAKSKLKQSLKVKKLVPKGIHSHRKSIVTHFSVTQDPGTAVAAHAPLEEVFTEKQFPPLRLHQVSQPQKQ